MTDDTVARDFDVARREREARHRTFRIGGEEFTYHTRVTPEQILPWYEMQTADVMLSQAEQVARMDEMVLLFLEPGQDGTWGKVRTHADPPINIADLAKLIEWLLEEQTGRPLSRPSDSTNGSTTRRTGTTSKARSSGAAAKA